MPEPTNTPAQHTGPAKAPEYNPAQHLSGRGTKQMDPRITDALNKIAGIDPAKAAAAPLPSSASAPPQKMDSPSGGVPVPKGDPKPSAPDDQPAPHVKFITPDDEPTPQQQSERPSEPKAENRAVEDLMTEEEWKPVPKALKKRLKEVKDDLDAAKRERDTILAERDLTKKEAAQFRDQIKSYEDRVKALEGSDARVKALEQELLAKEETLRITSYTQSTEFHSNYVKPLADAIQAASGLVREFQVQNPDGTVRMGTDADFQEVLAQPNYTLSLEKAIEKFGERIGPTVFDEAKRIRSLQQQQSKAVKEAGTKSQEWLQQQQQRDAERRQKTRVAFESAASEVGKKYSNLYLPPEGDKEAAAAHQQSLTLARLAIEGRPPEMAEDAYMTNAAKVYHRVASWPLQVLRAQRAEAEVSRLKERLSAYEKSTPTVEGRKSDGSTPTGTNPNDPRAQARAALEAIASGKSRR